jgi:hypothetical protein
MSPSRRHVRFGLAGLAGVSLALCLTVASIQIQNLPLSHGYVMQNGQLLGGDFLAFYVAGKLYDQHPDRLYDLEFQRDFRTELLGPASPALTGELPFVYPPLVAVMTSTLAPLDFWAAFALAAGMAALAGTFIVHLVGGSFGYASPGQRFLIVLTLWGFIPFSLNTVLGGQLAWLGMLTLGGVVWGLHTHRPLIAGMAMSLSYYKPPLFVFALIVLLITEGRRFIAGFALGAFLLVSLTILTVGVSGLVDFLTVVSRYTYGQELLEGVELPPGEGAGVYGLLTSLAADNGLVAAGSLMLLFALIGAFLVHVRRQQDPESSEDRAVWMAVLWIASVGLSLQCLRYDLALLFIPLMMLARMQRHFTRFHKVLLFISLLGFYFEFVVRKEMVLSYTLNLSSFLFLLILPSCLLTLAHRSRSRLREP